MKNSIPKFHLSCYVLSFLFVERTLSFWNLVCTLPRFFITMLQSHKLKKNRLQTLLISQQAMKTQLNALREGFHLPVLCLVGKGCGLSCQSLPFGDNPRLPDSNASAINPRHSSFLELSQHGRCLQKAKALIRGEISLAGRHCQLDATSYIALGTRRPGG